MNLNQQWVDLHKEHIISIWRFAKRLVPELEDEKNREYFLRYFFRNHDFVHRRCTSSNMRYPQSLNMEEIMLNYYDSSAYESISGGAYSAGVGVYGDVDEGSCEVYLDNTKYEILDSDFIPYAVHERFAEQIVRSARVDGYLNSDRAIGDLASLLRALQMDDKVIFV